MKVRDRRLVLSIRVKDWEKHACRTFSCTPSLLWVCKPAAQPENGFPHRRAGLGETRVSHCSCTHSLIWVCIPEAQPEGCFPHRSAGLGEARVSHFLLQTFADVGMYTRGAARWLPSPSECRIGRNARLALSSKPALGIYTGGAAGGLLDQ